MTVPSGYTFSKSVTTVAAALGTAKLGGYGFTIKASLTNTAKVYFGYSSGVTAGTAPATDGFELSAGESYFVPRASALDVDGVFVIAASGTQVVFVEGS